ncbi:MAG: acyloxyacyl hydrolase [Alphaproteobacteria bacterium]|nr:acyloxyacyl hydrolase [Alphaproteobacteria bacterium]
MKKLLTLSLALTLFAHSANANNPFFGADHQNLVMFAATKGLSSGWLFPNPLQDRLVPFAQLNFAYAAPNRFMNLYGRQSINVNAMIGFGTSVDREHTNHTSSPGLSDPNGIRWDWQDIASTAQIIYMMQDVALFHGGQWYFGVGAGGGMQRHQTARVYSKLIFNFRMFYGRKINDSTRAELFFSHFSNGSVTADNFSYNSIGIALTRSF